MVEHTIVNMEKIILGHKRPGPEQSPSRIHDEPPGWVEKLYKGQCALYYRIGGFQATWSRSECEAVFCAWYRCTHHFILSRAELLFEDPCHYVPQVGRPPLRVTIHVSTMKHVFYNALATLPVPGTDLALVSRAGYPCSPPAGRILKNPFSPRLLKKAQVQDRKRSVE